MAETVPIPTPPLYPIIGNMAEFTGGSFRKDVERLCETYGQIVRIHLGSRKNVILSSNKLINEVCDEKRFKKTIESALKEIRNGVHDGLFTADIDEPNWGKAHRILIPAFGPMPIRGMFDEMHDIASQLALKFARHGPQHAIPVSDNFTRLALDTLALCSMDFRFNSFYHEELHPFVAAMGSFLSASGLRRRRLGPGFLYRKADEKYWADIDVLRRTADEVVANRRANPEDRRDLLGSMLEGVDPSTNEKLTDSSITDQLITFLIAGHETTSGLLSFAFYNLLKAPTTYYKVQQEVDEVIGRGPIGIEHLTKLPYLASVLRETLRVNSPIGAFNVEPLEDTLLDGKYFVSKGEPIMCRLGGAHLDPVVFGDDAREFRPERMSDENFARLQEEFPNCWKPFGNGKRACIGRPFAWQEALLAMAMLFQNFNFTMDDPNYVLELHETLTIKPKGFDMRATLRHDMTPTELEGRLAGRWTDAHQESHDAKNKVDGVSSAAPSSSSPGRPLAIYYGSQSGTCEAMAQRVASDAPSHGFKATVVAPLDDATQTLLDKNRPVVIITASYEGQPPSNAALFVGWIESLKGDDALKGLSYAVYGCGHHDWVKTFHRVPTLVDARLAELGGERLVPFAGTDAADRDMFSDFETWEDDTLWPALKEKYGGPGGQGLNGANSSGSGSISSGYTVEVTVPRKSTLRQDVEEAVVTGERTLTRSGPAKKHLEIQLPTGMAYRAGDYLAILPLNPRDTVARVFRRFQLSWDAALTIGSDRPTTLPTGTPVSALDILGAYVELSQPATRRNIQALAESTDDKEVIAELQKLSGDNFSENVTQKKLSVLDVLEKYPKIALPVGSYLAMLPPMRVRQYSISSSPLASPSHATLTYSVLNQPSLSGQGNHVGVASSFLSSLGPGDKVHVSVRPSNTAFHLPADASATPLILVAAGSGLAPFRGFVEERAAQLAAGRSPAPALLFFGCRDPDVDDLYADGELARWAAAGAVDVRRAYSRRADRSAGCRYVQHRLYRDGADVMRLLDRGARVYVCGGRAVGRAVEDTFVRLAMERRDEGHPEGLTDEEARAAFEQLRNGRYATDVFD